MLALTTFNFLVFKHFCRRYTIWNCLRQFVTCVHLVLLLTLSTTEQTRVCIELIKQWRAFCCANCEMLKHDISFWLHFVGNGHSVVEQNYIWRDVNTMESDWPIHSKSISILAIFRILNFYKISYIWSKIRAMIFLFQHECS